MNPPRLWRLWGPNLAAFILDVHHRRLGLAAAKLAPAPRQPRLEMDITLLITRGEQLSRWL